MFFDTASIHKTRGSVAKVKFQIDLTKDKPHHVWMGSDEKDLTVGRWQALQCECIPD